MRRVRRVFLVVFVLLWISLMAMSAPEVLLAQSGNQTQEKEAVGAERISDTDADLQAKVPEEKKEITVEKGPASSARQVRFLGFIWFLGNLK